MNNGKPEIIMSLFLLFAVAVASFVVLPKDCATQNAVAKNICIAIDAGHGGWDSGKVGSTGVKEKDLNLTVSFKIKELLESTGFEVVMVRDTDRALSDTKAKDMRERCALIEKSKAALTLSIHMNSFSSGSAKGAQVFYYSHSAEGKKVAQIVQDELKNFDKSNKRSCKANNEYYMLVHTATPTIVVECGFLSNPEEEKKLSSDEYRQKISEVIASAIEKYFCTDRQAENGNNY